MSNNWPCLTTTWSGCNFSALPLSGPIFYPLESILGCDLVVTRRGSFQAKPACLCLSLAVTISQRYYQRPPSMRTPAPRHRTAAASRRRARRPGCRCRCRLRLRLRRRPGSRRRRGPRWTATGCCPEGVEAKREVWGEDGQLRYHWPMLANTYPSNDPQGNAYFHMPLFFRSKE